MFKAQYKRVVLKISGEALMGDQEFGISSDMIRYVAEEIRSIVELGVQIGHRRRRREHLPGHRRQLLRHGPHLGRPHGHARHRDQQPGPAGRAGETGDSDPGPDRHRDAPGGGALHPAPGHPPPGKGPGGHFRCRHRQPYFTTDTAAVLRGQEIHAEILLKATKVDGLYDSDPVKNKDAKLLKQVTYMEVLGTAAQGDGHDGHLARHGQRSAAWSSSSSRPRATSARWFAETASEPGLTPKRRGRLRRTP